MKVIKRNGRQVEYDRNKIIVAIQRANDEVDEKEKITEGQIENIVASIENRNVDALKVEDIQDIIEQKLMAERKFILAKTYIIYRYTTRTPLLLLHSVTLLPERSQETLQDVFFSLRIYQKHMTKAYYIFTIQTISYSLYSTAALSISVICLTTEQL